MASPLTSKKVDGLDELAKRAETLAARWCDEIQPFIDRGPVGEGLVLAVLIQMARALLDGFPPESRQNFIRAVATPGIAIDPAIEEARQ